MLLAFASHFIFPPLKFAILCIPIIGAKVRERKKSSDGVNGDLSATSGLEGIILMWTSRYTDIFVVPKKDLISWTSIPVNKPLIEKEDSGL